MKQAKPRTYADFQRFNPFCHSEWRWERVLELCDRLPTPGRPTHRDDDVVRVARNFLLRFRARTATERTELFWENPGLFYAYQIHENSTDAPDIPFVLQARILADQAWPEISEEMRLSEETIDWYEKLFFNVKDKLKNHDWIIRNVLVPATMRNFGSIGSGRKKKRDTEESPWTDPVYAVPFYDATIKMFAYFGGPLALDIALSGFRRGYRLDSRDNSNKYLDDCFRTAIKKRSAQAAQVFEVNKWNVMELFQVNTQIIALEQQAENEQQIRAGVETHVQRMMENLKLTVGDKDRPAEGPLGGFDDSAVELRDDEMLMVGAGQESAALEGLKLESLPPPRKRREAIPIDDESKE
jgi:hypothetical protein